MRRGTAIGAPYTFQTTLRSEYVSDLTGERAILLAAVHGLVEALYRRYRDQGMSETEAYRHSVDCVTGLVSWIISKEGLDGLYRQLDQAGREVFGRAYAAAYPVGLELVHEVYDEVSSGNEIRSVILAGKRFARFPMGKIDQSAMWRAGEVARRSRDDSRLPLDPFTAGIFLWREDGPGRHVHRDGASVLGDRERIRHRGHGLAQPLHARPRGLLHGR